MLLKIFLNLILFILSYALTISELLKILACKMENIAWYSHLYVIFYAGSLSIYQYNFLLLLVKILNILL